MNCLDLTLPSPAENLACDEALLDDAEAGRGSGVLRFWESPDYFVVVGYANRIVSETNLFACEENQIPILRRCSGGGTVLLGPGCLNYSLILKITEAGPLHTIAAANQFIMERNRDALEALLGRPVQVQGHTDLAIDGRKCSGNSQRRKRNHLLFHGTFLLNFDLARIEQSLAVPSKQPDYRKNRGHGEFLMNLGVGADSIKTVLRKVWNAKPSVEMPPHESIVALAREKYATRDWNFKF